MEVVLKKWIKRTANRRRLVVAIQPDALHFASLVDLPLPATVALEAKPWISVLAAQLKQYSITNLEIDLVFNAQLYQSHQIDAPNIPHSEWATALPFLLKDLTNDKLNNIVAAGYPLSDSSKAQTYVTTKKWIIDAAQVLKKQGCELANVFPEQEVWGYAQPENSPFLLLQRSQGGDVKLDAFVNRECHFQRTLRGIVTPITEQASSEQQLDSLALELQRSVDYLSSQLKGVRLHQLKVCCDEENSVELVQGLAARLNVKVSALSETDNEITSGDLLAQYALDNPTQRLSFYQEHLKPKKNYLGLTTLVASWTLALIVILSWMGWESYQLAQLDSQTQQEQQKAEQLAAQLSDLNRRMSVHKPSPEKTAAVERLKRSITAQQASLSALSTLDERQQLGYSSTLTALANVAHPDIALTQIQINAQNVNFKGMARNAKAVPSWVALFQQQLPLVGRDFEQLDLTRDEHNILHFSLKAQRGKTP